MHTELRHSFLISNRAEKDVHLKMELNQVVQFNTRRPRKYFGVVSGVVSQS